jgi:pimeloyl-ACP methyl ester carboxylesterase
MTPAKNGKALAAAIPGSRITVLEGAGHLLMSERPEEAFAALRS